MTSHKNTPASIYYIPIMGEIIGALMGLSASIVLMLESYWKALTPTTHKILTCDINAQLSCSSVASSWQASLIHMPNGDPIPNALWGIIAFSVFLTLGVLRLTMTYLMKKYDVHRATITMGVNVFPRIISIFYSLGLIFVTLMSAWLWATSAFTLHVFCPWCLSMDIGVLTLIVSAFLRYALTVRDTSHISRYILWTIARSPWLSIAFYGVVILLFVCLTTGVILTL